MNYGKRLLDLRKSTRITTRVLLFIAALTVTALGCGWMGTSHSVRFNTYQTEREMTRLPPLPTRAEGMNELRLSWEMEDPGRGRESDYTLGSRRSKEVDELWDRAEVAEKEGKLGLARDLLREYLNSTRIARGVWFYPDNRQQRRNSANDRLDALSALDRGSSTSRVQAYLNARRTHDWSKSAEEIEVALGQIESDLNLRDNVAYLRAAWLYQLDQFEQAARAFVAITRKYPHSEKREASLFMAAVAVMKTSKAYTPTSGDEAHLHEYGPSKPRHTVSVDGPWHHALAGFKKVMAEYSSGRYLRDAKGWIAYLMLRNNDRAAALVEYYKLLADKQDENARIEAAFSLTLVRHHATDEEMSRVEKALARQPDAALAYAYHNLYNYSIDPGEAYLSSEEVEDASGYEESEKESERKLAFAQGKERSRILAFSLRLMESYPKLAIGGGFALRAAQASLEMDNNEAAVQFARRALQSRINNEERAQALWTSGVAEHRLRRFSSARKSFLTLLRDYPKTELTDGARRTLAMIAEDEGDIEAALEQYIALDYYLDVAYFVDILMTTEQLEMFIQRHPDSPKANEFTYALGVRYLRANRWNDARTTFGRVRATGASDYNLYYTGDECLTPETRTKKCVDPKEVENSFKDDLIITHRLLMRDVQTANDLQTLEQTVNEMDGDEAKAEAMYQFASYQYEASSLLFYNPIAWTGARYWNLSHFANEGKYRSTNESQVLFAYMQEHDTPARALKVYLEVADRFPHTRAGRDALYSAAVCHERLSGYNRYWRDIYGAGLHAGARLVTYTNVKADYPGYQLPRGTYGWQPSTRTVNGGPGWAAPPKYIPPPTRMKRLETSLWSVVDWVHLFWVEKGRRWLTLITILVALWFTRRIAIQNRKLLRPKIARLRTRMARQAVPHPWTTMFWIDSLEVERREKLKQFMKERGLEFWELASDGKTRPILLRSILSHSFLVGLLISLLWTLHFG